MTLDDLFDGRITEPLIPDEQFRTLLTRCWSEVQAERVVRRRRTRGRPSRRRDVDAFEMDVPFELAELR